MCQEVKGYCLVVMATILWGLCGAISKYFFNQALSPFVLVEVRLTLSAALLLLFLYLRHPDLLRLKAGDRKKMLLFGMAGMASTQFFYLFTLSKLNVATAVFLQSLAPVFIVLFMVVWKKERLGLASFVALILACTGSAFILSNQVVPGKQWPLLGVISGIASAIAVAFYNLYGKKMLTRYNSWAVLAYGFLFGAVPFWFIIPPWIILHQHYSWQTLLFFLYICIFATIIPFGLALKGLHYLKPYRASIIETLEPVNAGLFAYLLLGETLSILQLIGCGMVLTAVLILQTDRKASSPAVDPS